MTFLGLLVRDQGLLQTYVDPVYGSAACDWRLVHLVGVGAHRRFQILRMLQSFKREQFLLGRQALAVNLIDIRSLSHTVLRMIWFERLIGNCFESPCSRCEMSHRLHHSANF